MGAPSTLSSLSTFLDHLPVAVVLIDGGRIVAWNSSAEVLYGHQAADVLGRPALEVLFDPADAPALERTLVGAAEGGQWRGDARVCRRDGVMLVSEFRAAPVGPDGSLVAWIAADRMDHGLAEQERAVLLSAEHAARATAEEALGLVEAVVGSAPVGIAVFDLQLRYVRVNAAYAQLSGVPEADHVGGYVGEVVPLPPEVSADLRRVVTTGRRILGRSVELVLGGERRHFRVDYYPVRTASGLLVGAGATVLEVTEAVRAEAERARLLAAAEDARRRLAVLATAGAALSTTMEVDRMVDRLARALVPGTADWCVVELFDERGVAEHVSVAHRDAHRADALAAAIQGAPLDRNGAGPVAAALRSGHALRFTSESIAAALLGAAVDRSRPELAGPFSVRSALVVPLRSGESSFGVLILSTEGQELDDDDLDLAVEVAHRASLAVSNARAYQREHSIAEELQRGLLPAQLPPLAAVELGVRYLAATAGVLVGGDWYDVIALGDGAAVVSVGDVVGHNIEAASAMGQLRAGLRFYAYEERDRPSAVLGRLDRLVDQLALPMATCLLAVVDPSGPSLTWSSAGHPPPLLVRGGRADFLDGKNGALLGSGVVEAVDNVEVLEDGDLLILYTDGLVERRGEPIDDGLERLRAAATEWAQGTEASGGAERACDAVVSALLPTGQQRSDDVAVLAVHLLPSRFRPGPVACRQHEAPTGAG
ncbi:MAG TPA: SpoIIE family protein phosphatase [Acidimicrobiales bacterium]|nr:SpoIIE family protein phosphatase [Acidimicrobiales bacterium]